MYCTTWIIKIKKIFLFYFFIIKFKVRTNIQWTSRAEGLK